MLVLSRAKNQAILIGDEVRVEVYELRGNNVRLAITAPDTVQVDREEVREEEKRTGIRKYMPLDFVEDKPVDMTWKQAVEKLQFEMQVWANQVELYEKTARELWQKENYAEARFNIGQSRNHRRCYGNLLPIARSLGCVLEELPAAMDYPPKDPADQAETADQAKLEPEDNSPEMCLNMLLLTEAGDHVNQLPEVIAGWTEQQRREAIDWAAAIHLAASDNDTKVLPCPAHVMPLLIPAPSTPTCQEG
jgi:carbon storage regulator